MSSKSTQFRKIRGIVGWFEAVCAGIRAEYENGASHRDIGRDKEHLRGLVKDLVK